MSGSVSRASRVRRRFAVAVATTAVAAAAAAPAAQSALLPLPVIGVGTLIEPVTCPAGTTLNNLAAPIPGVSSVTQQTQFMACMTHFLDFEWRTSYPGSPNPITGDRIITTLGVPTPLNLDTDLLPEVIATALPLAVNKFQLSFRRVDAGLSGDLAMSQAELIVSDPTGGSLPREHIGIGMRADENGRIPDVLSLTATIESYQPPINFTTPPRIHFAIGGNGQAKRAAIFGDLFNEDYPWGPRDSMVRGTVGMQPLPWSLGTRLTMREDDGIDADITTTDRTRVDADVKIHGDKAQDGSRQRQHLNAVVDQLPRFTGLKFRPIPPTTPPTGATEEEIDAARGGQELQYAASDPISKVDVSYDDDIVPADPDAAPVPSLKARIGIRDIPTGMTFKQLGSVTTFDAVDEGIGRAEARVALNGDLIDFATDRPGVNFKRTKSTDPQRPDPIAIAGRIDGVRHVKLDTVGGRTVVEAGIKRQPFDLAARDDITGITADGAIEDLPRDVKISYLPARPEQGDAASGDETPLRVLYDAGPDTIGLIRFKAAFDETIAGKLDQIEGRITDLPPVLDVTADLDEDQRYTFNASDPLTGNTKAIGGIEALARNTRAVEDELVPELTDGRTGISAVLREGSDPPFAARGRLLGLKNVVADLKENDFHVEIAPVPFEARALFDEVRGSEILGRTLLGTIENLPSTIDVDLDLDGADAKTVYYKGSDPIGKVAVQLDGDELYAPEPKINRIRAGIFDAPEEFRADLGNAGKLDIDATTGVGGIEALITSGPDPVFPADEHRAYVETGENIVVKAQLLGFQRFTLEPEPVKATFKTQRSLPLYVDAKLDLDDDEVPETLASLDIVNVPANLSALFERDGHLEYTAKDAAGNDERIQHIRADGRFFEDRGDGPMQRDFAAGIDGVPSEITVDLALDQADSKKVSYVADGVTDKVFAKLNGEKLYAAEEKISRLEAAVEDIPAKLSVEMRSSGAIDLLAGEEATDADGIGKIGALISSGPDAPLDPAKHAAYVEKGKEIVAGAQLLGFKQFKLSGFGGSEAQADTPIDVLFRTSNAVPLDVDAKIDLDGDSDEVPETEATLDIEDVPARMQVTAERQGRVHYVGSQPIDRILATAKGYEKRGSERLERNLRAELLDIPGEMELSLADDPSGDKTVAYTADGRISLIDLQANGPKLVAAEERLSKLQARVEGLTDDLSAELGNDGHVVVNAVGGIDKILALVSDGSDPALPANEHAVKVQRDDDALFAKAQLLGFTKFELVPDPVKAVLHTQQALPLRVDGQVDEERGAETLARTIALDVVNVPAQLSAELKKPDGDTTKLEYRASSQIQDIDLSVMGPKLYSDNGLTINKLTAGVDALTSQLDVVLDADGGILVDTLGQGVGAVRALATSGPEPTMAANAHVAYAETGQNTVAAAQLLGFKKFQLTPNPADVTFETLAPSKPLDVDVKLDLDDNGTAEATGALDIVNVPSTIRATLGDDASFTYDGSEDITSIGVLAKGLPDVAALPAKIDQASLLITGIPRHLEASYSNNNGFKFKATDQNGTLDSVNTITASAQTLNPPALPTPAASSHAVANRVGNTAAARVQVSGLREIDVRPQPLDVTVDTDVLSAFDADLANDEDANGTPEDTAKVKLRSNITRVRAFQQSLAGVGRRFEVNTGEPLGTADVNVVSNDLPQGIQKVDLRLEDLPDRIRATFPDGSDVVDVDLIRDDGTEDSRGIDLIDLRVNDPVIPRFTITNRNNASVAADNVYAKLLADDVIDEAAVIIRGLRGVTYGTSPHTKIGLDAVASQARPVALDVDRNFAGGGMAINGHIDKIPENMVLDLGRVSDEPFRYSSDTAISQIELRLKRVLGPFPEAFLDVRDLPTFAQACFRADSTKASCLDSNRFDARTDRKISVGFYTDRTTGPAINLKTADLCLTLGCGGRKIEVDNLVLPKQIEFEAGAFATLGSAPSFNCFDGMDDFASAVLGLPDALACTFAYPVNAVSSFIDGTRVGGYTWFDTGNTELDTGQIVYTEPLPDPIKDLTIHLNLPKVTANEAFIEVNAKPLALNLTGTVGGTMSCQGSGTTLFAQSGIFVPIPDIDLTAIIPGFIYDAADFLDLTIPNTVVIPDIDEDFRVNILPQLCP